MPKTKTRPQRIPENRPLNDGDIRRALHELTGHIDEDLVDLLAESYNRGVVQGYHQGRTAGRCR